MSTAQFAMALALIAIGVLVAMYFIFRAINGHETFQPIQHEDAEP